ncbi:hypothetical protein ABN763_18740 [Spongiivirga sp. MCCC 1A20706]|uniref:hypothetical protein n=1 Tax=Spongiivirga sp. MCCC 1A20706 TaxID=3160963 RepID=UPI0039778D74
MNILSIKKKFEDASIYHSEDSLLGSPSVIGYEKKFRWIWMATQLNTFIVATDFGDLKIDSSLIEGHLSDAFKFSKKHYKGWPIGFQSGIGVISILISSNITEEAKEYCQKLKSGKKWAGFTIPVVYDSGTNEIYEFEKYPMWGRIYYPHFRRLINNLKS